MGGSGRHPEQLEKALETFLEATGQLLVALQQVKPAKPRCSEPEHLQEAIEELQEQLRLADEEWFNL